jgi:hypothetical protein
MDYSMDESCLITHDDDGKQVKVLLGKVSGSTQGGTREGGSLRGDDHGIYINNNNVEIVIRNIETGKVSYVNNHKKCIAYMRRKIFAWAEVTDNKKEDLGITYALIELSYRNNLDWGVSDITKYCQAVINSVGRSNVYDYAFVLEVKPVGRNLHYHVAFHIKPSVYVPTPDKSGMWLHGSTHIVRKKYCNPYYMVKYTTKQVQKEGIEFPRGCRKYGVWLNRDYYSQEEINIVKRASYPKYVLDKVDELGCENFSIVRNDDSLPDCHGGWLITPKDKLHPLFDTPVWVPSVYQVFMGSDLEVHRSLLFPEE